MSVLKSDTRKSWLLCKLLSNPVHKGRNEIINSELNYNQKFKKKKCIFLDIS